MYKRFSPLKYAAELCHSPLQPEEGTPENVVLFPPQENHNDSIQVQYLCVCLCIKESVWKFKESLVSFFSSEHETTF